MSELGQKKIFNTLKYSYIPGILFGFAVFLYCSMPQWGLTELEILNMAFFGLCLGNFLFLIAINQTKPLFALLWLLGAYIGINRLKVFYGADILTNSSYVLLMVLLPLNWLIFALLPQKTLYQTRNFYILCLVLIQGILMESVSSLKFSFFLVGNDYEMIGLWIMILLILLVTISRHSEIVQTGMFFALLCVMLGMMNASSAVALAVFFTAAVLVLLIGSIHEYVYTYFRDVLTGVYSRKSYYRHGRNSFPLKYSLGVICLDDYAKLLKVFGEKKLNLLTKMILNKILAAGTGATIYRYEDDEFIMVFKNQDLKQSYEHLENIRRSIAGSEFVLSAKKIVKVTISAGVSEKKRSDADVEAVLGRAREVLQKAYKFTQNMTSKA